MNSPPVNVLLPDRMSGLLVPDFESERGPPVSLMLPFNTKVPVPLSDGATVVEPFSVMLLPMVEMAPMAVPRVVVPLNTIGRVIVPVFA